nr:hypothetical protein [Tanacetum cinerariifolium]
MHSLQSPTRPYPLIRMDHHEYMFRSQNTRSTIHRQMMIFRLDGDEAPEEDPSEEHDPKDNDEDLEEDPNKEHEPEDSKTEPFEEDETAVTPPPPRHHGAKISVRPQTPMVASTYVLIDAFADGSSSFPLPPTSPAYD